MIYRCDALFTGDMIPLGKGVRLRHPYRMKAEGILSLRRAWAAVGVGWWLTMVGATAQPDLAPVRAWIEKGRALRSIAAEFKQERYLRTVNKPLVSVGRLWFTQAGALRWEIGSPPRVLALRERREADMTVLDMKAQTRRTLTPAALAEQRSPYAMLDAGFPASLEEFEKNFRVKEVETKGEEIRIETQTTDGRMAIAVMKIVFVLEATHQQLRAVEIWFRDGSKIVNTFTRVTENAPLPASLLAVPTGEWKDVK